MVVLYRDEICRNLFEELIFAFDVFQVFKLNCLLHIAAGVVAFSFLIRRRIYTAECIQLEI